MSEKRTSEETTNIPVRIINDNKAVLSELDLAEYLGITTKDLEVLLHLDEQKRAVMSGGIYDTYSLMPYLELPNKKKIFLKSEIENWVKYHSTGLTTFIE